MEHSRPKSGILKTGPAQQRRHSSKYQQRKYTKDICKSINIFPIKIQNQNLPNQKLINQTLKNINLNSSKSHLQNKQNNKRRTLLSIKSKPSLRFQDVEDFKLVFQQSDTVLNEQKITLHKGKRTSLQIANFIAPNFSIEEDTDKLFQTLQKKKDIMMFDHTRLIIEATKFKSLLNDFQSKFKQVKTDRDSLSQKVNKYEYYFKQMRLKHLPLPDQQQSPQKNQQLKILNLQKKVQTLNYIIKQYRTNNNQQIKNFEQKLKDFKPNIERELTQKLAQTNQKYQNLLKKVSFFEKQCKTNAKVDWKQLMNDFEQSKQQNERNLKYISDLSEKLNQLSHLMSINEQKIQKIQTLQQQNIEQKSKIQLLNDRKLQLQQEIQEKDKKIDDLNHLYEETSFKLQGLQNLQFRIQNKDKTIKKNTVVINRLQCENIQLKSKMQTVLSQFQSRMFCQKNLQQSLLKANNSIHDLTNRLHETFVDFCENPSHQATKQKQFFIGHLFQKVKGSYNQIINEYQNQLKLINVQCQKWKFTFDMISKNRDQKLNFVDKMKIQLEKIQEKKVRCQQYFNKLSNQALDQGKKTGKQCQSCKHLIAYWGQLQNSYSQTKNIVDSVMKMQSVDYTSNRIQVQVKQNEKQEKNMYVKYRVNSILTL